MSQKTIESLKTLQELDADFLRKHLELIPFANILKSMLKDSQEFIDLVKADHPEIDDKTAEMIHGIVVINNSALLANLIEVRRELDKTERSYVQKARDVLESNIRELMSKPETEMVAIHVQQALNKLNEIDED